ncbi:hypothetical protein [Sphingomonas sp.]|uniref:hypothetical protein n=1 Tax=Sphingomonas sp. TaxID=28214 RepID=UPI001EC877F0|nr:hypothetical protein [Sphingomonas sp.]MBX3593141.1 hypothetical protein [Sphingomonas sp.]
MDHPEEAVGQLIVSGQADQRIMIERFCSGRLPRPRFSGSIGSKLFKIRHSASVQSPRLKSASKRQL